jgi:hypothetical protein
VPMLGRWQMHALDYSIISASAAQLSSLCIEGVKNDIAIS